MEQRLRDWYAEHGRVLPWRRRRSLYRVWVSEIMLQQTQAATVGPYFHRFLRRFPSVKRLAEAPIETVLRAWEGLGYYRRARQLHQAARQIRAERGGRLPRTVDDWTALPGVGRYTAHAILSFALDERLPILEANTRRLYCRLLGLSGDGRSAAAERQLWDFAWQLLPPSDIADWNDALIDLGATRCLPSRPACDECPWRTFCLAARHGTQADCGRSAMRPAVTEQTEAALVVTCGDRLFLQQRGGDERWSGLWDFPRLPADASPSTTPLSLDSTMHRHIDRYLRGFGIRPRQVDYWTTIRYTITRYRVTLHAVRVEARSLPTRRRSPPARWFDATALESLPLTRPARRLVRQMARSPSSLASPCGAST